MSCTEPAVATAAQGPKRPGERIYKGHKSYDLMLNLQLGIRYSVGGVHARPSAPMLLPSDFHDTVGAPDSQSIVDQEIYVQNVPRITTDK